MTHNMIKVAPTEVTRSYYKVRREESITDLDVFIKSNYAAVRVETGTTDIRENARLRDAYRWCVIKYELPIQVRLMDKGTKLYLIRINK